jgi:hypothetical protein
MDFGRGWMKGLAQRWKVSPSRVGWILLSFSCTGFTVVFLKQPLHRTLGVGAEPSIGASILYYLLVLPFYNVLLLAYGALFGQFDFFWAFERRLLAKVFGRRSG